MIPVELELHNFLAYRHPAPLTFSGMHLACLVGANGAGKSSLLDAITWALWGRARARRDDDLIHGEEIEMTVIFTFESGGNLYRVTRFRSRQGRGRSELLLEVADGDEWRNITENTIRNTQQKIDSILHLNYETFINSAYLVQGRADEFTKKGPAERKAILGEILGLQQWAFYEERVKEALREGANDARYLEDRIREIDEELGHADLYQQQLNEANRLLRDLADQLEGIEARYHELESARRRRADLVNQIDEARRRLALDQREMETLYKDQIASQERLAHLGTLLEQRDEIEQGYTQLQDALRQEREVGERLLEQKGLRERREQLNAQIRDARSQIEATRSALLQRQQDLTERSAAAVNHAEMEARRKQVTELESREEACRVWRAQIEEMSGEQSALTAENRALWARMTEINKHLEMIREAAEAFCPLCKQPLDDKHRLDLIEDLEHEGQEKGELYRENLARLQELEEHLAAKRRAVRDAEAALRNLPPLRERLALMTSRAEEAAQADEELESVRHKLEALERTLAVQDYAHDEQAALADIEEQLTALSHDEEAYRRARQTVDNYRPFEQRYADLSRAMAEMPEIEAALARLDERIAGWQERIMQTQTFIAGLQEEVAQLDEQLVDYSTVEAERTRLQDAKSRAHAAAGAAQQRVDSLNRMREQRTAHVARLEELGAERGILEELRLAFGKDGIPAMIIEAAIPEIETEANEILARMTGGRMHIRFDTQREKVTGGIKETLDIKIADELGTRDYDTFSGGEAFRVNFAIRLAMSRLLARRAGAQLRTLIIDEGFGTQDEEGRARLVEAINAIQSDFDLILVITHIDELRDAFPVRIEITKTRDGSLIDVV
ncbi:MAG: hypothetical protein Kow00124_03570 [Anaerolineae bacterium]